MPLLCLRGAQHRPGSTRFPGLAARRRAWSSGRGCCCHGTTRFLLRSSGPCVANPTAPCLGTPSHTSWLVPPLLQLLSFFFHESVRVPSQAACIQGIKQLVPCLIYSCHPLIYKFHDAIKIKSQFCLARRILSLPSPLLCR